MGYLTFRPHVMGDGTSVEQVLPPHDALGRPEFGFDPPMNNRTWSAHPTLCSNCLKVVPVGIEFEVCVCEDDPQGHIAEGTNPREHMFVLCSDCTDE